MKNFWMIMSVVVVAATFSTTRANAQPQTQPPATQTNTVYIMGEVAAPGAYKLKPTEGVIDLINRAGGVIPTAALTKVTVRRKDGATAKIDLFSALQKGAKLNYVLHDGDVVVVARNLSYVYVSGEVLHPGSFLIPENGTLTIAQALTLAGGLRADQATLKIVISRETNGKRKLYDVLKTIDAAAFNEPLQKNDVLMVLKAPVNRVEPQRAPPNAHFWLLDGK